MQESPRILDYTMVYNLKKDLTHNEHKQTYVCTLKAQNVFNVTFYTMDEVLTTTTFKILISQTLTVFTDHSYLQGVTHGLS